MMSLPVVIIGPEAMAGSTPTRTKQKRQHNAQSRSNENRNGHAQADRRVAIEPA